MNKVDKVYESFDPPMDTDQIMTTQRISGLGQYHKQSLNDKSLQSVQCMMIDEDVELAKSYIPFNH